VEKSVLATTAQRFDPRASLRAVLAGVLVVTLAGCVPAPSLETLPPSPDRPWEPAPEWVPPPPPPTAPPGPLEKIPADILSGERPVTLAEVVDVALRTSPRTRETWLGARAAAAEMGSRASAYYPQADLSGELQRVRTSAVGGQFTFQQTTYGPALDLTYLLFDFGGRKADVEDARQALFAADWTHNAAVQEVTLEVEQAYYLYLGTRAARSAAQADVAGAKANLEAAEARHDAGVATIADVLQARTAYAQATLSLEDVEGQMNATRGALATAMGLPTHLPVEVGELPHDLPVEKVTTEVEEMLTRAQAERPDLLAARAQVLAAQRRVDRESANRYPSLVAEATSERVYYSTSGSHPSDNYSARLLVRFPLFTGFQKRWEVKKARVEAEQAAASAENLRQQVSLQVWTSYYELETAAQRVKTSADLLASAEESAEVAAGRYKAGVGSILDLLAAQAALADARAQDVRARADWLLAAAQLARDVGVLEPPAPDQEIPYPLTGAASSEKVAAEEVQP
jgi:outer membrane protein